MNARRTVRERGLVETLRRILELSPIVDLIKQLEYINRTGRPARYRPRTMVALAVARVLFRAPCWTNLLELLAEHSELRQACHIGANEATPSPNACYKLTAKLRELGLLEECAHALVDLIAARVPGFGRIIALDATDIETYGNARRDPPSDGDARWGVRHTGNGDGTEAYMGYKLHLMVDADCQIPIGWKLTPANASDGDHAVPILEAARSRAPWLKPEFAIMDKGYDTVDVCRRLEEEHGCHPVIPQRQRGHGNRDGLDPKGRPCCEKGVWTWKGTDYANRRTKWACPYEEDSRVHSVAGCRGPGKGRRRWLSWRQNPRRHKLIPEGTRKFKTLYAKRVSVEREFSLLKDGFLLDSHRARALDGVDTHVHLCLVVRLAVAVLSLR